MSLLVGLILLTSTQVSGETPVVFKGAGGLELFGTVTMPTRQSSAKVPAVLLLPGSGPTDRNGNQPPAVVTDVLKQLAQSLASKGVASLRFDKRAIRNYRPSWPKELSDFAEYFKWENFVADATNGYQYLRTVAGVDPKRVGIIGHSEGAEIALQIGSNLSNTPDEPAAIVTIGGAGRPMGPILNEQIARLLDKQKALPPIKKQYMDALNRIVNQVVKDGTYPTDIPGGLAALFNITTTKIMRSYCTIDPCDLAKKYTGPVLLINGAHDTQVSAERDTPKLKEALGSRPKGTVQVLIVPDASHNLKSTISGNDDAFVGPIVPLAVEKIDDFIVKELRG